MLLGAILRFGALTRDMRFHPDEALFSTFARNAAVNGDWLLAGPLDKTPLAIYVNALSMRLFAVAPLPNGVLDLDLIQGEFAARMPGLFASIVLIAVVYTSAQSLYRDRFTALIAAMLTALSPFAIAFSATAFTDGLMLLFIALSLLAASRNNPTQASVYLVLGFASKQQAVFYLPLVIMVAWGIRAKHVSPVQWIFRLITPMMIGFVVLLLWDAARMQPVSIFALAGEHNNPERVSVRVDELIPRLQAWLSHGAWMLGAGWQTTLLSIIGITAVLLGRVTPRPYSGIDRLLFAYTIGYMALHWIVAFNTYDRYLLPLLPIIVLLAARGIVQVMSVVRARHVLPLRMAMTIIIAALLLPTAIDAANERISIGGDHGEHDGIIELANWLNDKPIATVIYDHWLGWELGYYMGQWTDKRRVYYPTPDALVTDALQLPEIGTRYLPAPADVPLEDWLTALRDVGFSIELAYHEHGFIVYALTPPG